MGAAEAAVGRAYVTSEVYLVGREKVREFAGAIGDRGAASNEPEAARALGYPDVVAPPTFAFSVAMRATELLLSDPELGLALHRIVHGDQKFTHHRAIVAGDELTCTLTVNSVRHLKGTDVISSSTTITDADGETVCTATSTLVHRAEEPA